MQKAIRAAALGAAMVAGLALSGCPVQPSYPSTITPVYAATQAGGLFVYNGTSWTNYTNANTGSGLASSALSSVVVFGSGSGAVVLAGGNANVSQFNGTAWTQLTSGLGSAAVHRLVSGSNVYAATSGGLSILNSDGTTWTNNAAVGSANDVSTFGAYTYVAADTGLFVYNGTSLVGGAPIPRVTVLPGCTKVTAVFVDSLGDVIAGTDTGLAVQFGGAGLFISQLPGTPFVNQVTLDARGYLYAATSTGLYIIGSSAFQILPTATLCVCVDGAGTIYAGTATGLQASRNGGLTWTTQLSGPQVNSVTTTAPLYSF